MTTLGKYELHEQLGKGGFGTVYRATDTRLEREVALKILHPQLTIDPDFLERFRGEAKLVASLRNPNIVTVYELDEEEGRAFISMEYLSGGSLKEKLEDEGALPPQTCLTILSQVCSGLIAAHKKDLIHRDIKPGNILFDAEGHAVLADFGLAKAVHASTSSSISRPGSVGTPSYRAPEIWEGAPPASPATDIYALGCVLFEMLTGKILFDGNTTEVIIAKHLIEGPKIPAEMPEYLKFVLSRALSRQPEDRYQDAAELYKALQSLDNSKPSVSTGMTKDSPADGESNSTMEKNVGQAIKPPGHSRSIPPAVSRQDQLENHSQHKTVKQLLAGFTILALIVALISIFNHPDSPSPDLPAQVQKVVSNIIHDSPAPTEPPPTDEPYVPSEQNPARAKVLQNLNCRSGPDTAYPIKIVLLEDSSITPLGRNETADWVYVQAEESEDNCWVYASFLDFLNGIQPGSLLMLTPLPTMESINARAIISNPWSNEEKSKVTISLSGFTPNSKITMTKSGMEGQYLGKKWWNVSQTQVMGKTDNTGCLEVKVEFSPSVKVNLTFADDSGRSVSVSIKLP